MRVDRVRFAFSLQRRGKEMDSEYIFRWNYTNSMRRTESPGFSLLVPGPILVYSRRWSKADLGLGGERLDPFPFQGDPYKQGSKDITPGQRSLSLDALPGAGYSTADKAPLKLKQQHKNFSPIILVLLYY
ncbi:hypothetical protein B296_00001556 [Ensete ventricosum]|uniref:Uncharacterized protein n=1 Tax=Ensete ventricosum TaxID=4639 RepID=A0A426YJ93_ENSVE|nr:hypothetical protein B296_00001556 [Ensete ventricosum]